METNLDKDLGTCVPTTTKNEVDEELAFTKDESIALYMGKSFDSVDKLNSLLKLRREQFGETWVKGATTKIPENTANQIHKSLKNKLVYLRLQVRCHHFGIPRRRGIGLREITSRRRGCPVEIQLRIDKISGTLSIRKCNLNHNHSLDIESVFKKPTECLNEEQLNELVELRSAGYSIQKIIDHYMKTYNIELYKKHVFNYFGTLRLRKIREKRNLLAMESKLKSNAANFKGECVSEMPGQVSSSNIENVKYEPEEKTKIFELKTEKDMNDDLANEDDCKDSKEGVNDVIDNDRLEKTVNDIHLALRLYAANDVERELRHCFSQKVSSNVSFFGSQFQVRENQKVYYVSTLKCSCDCFLSRLLPCRHIFAVRWYSGQRLFHTDGICSKHLTTFGNNNKSKTSSDNGVAHVEISSNNGKQLEKAEKLSLISKVCLDIAEAASDKNTEEFMDQYSALLLLKNMWKEGHKVKFV